MLKILMMMLTVMTLSAMLMMMCTIMFKKSILDREKMSPFECGFDPKSSSRLPFSIQFFLIAVLFLVFDVEIVIILPMILTMKMTNMTYWFVTSMMFLLILVMGLYHEWNNGVLEWAT